MGEFQGEARLADSSRAHDRDEARLGERGGHIGELTLPADERRQDEWQRGPLENRRRDADRGVEGRVLREHGALQRPELGRRIEPELVDEVIAGVAIRLERVALPAAAVQGNDQLGPEPLA